MKNFSAKHFPFACLLLFLVVGCSDDAAPTSATESAPHQIVEAGTEVTATLDPDTGEPVATNAPAASSNPDAEVDAKSTVDSYSTFRSGPVPNHNEREVDGRVSTSYVLTAIGGRIDGVSDWTTLRLKGQRIRSDGTLGHEVTKYIGSDPYHELEAYYEVPSGYVIVGIGAREGSRDLTTLWVYYRNYDSSTQTLTGNTYVKKVGYLPGHELEARFVTSDENTLVNDLDRYVMVGAAFHSYDDDITTMLSHVGKIQ